MPNSGNGNLSDIARNIGYDPYTTRLFLFLIGSGVIATAVGGGAFIGMMREHIKSNEATISWVRQNTTERINELSIQTRQQDILLDDLRTMAIRTQAVVDTIHADVQTLARYMDEERQRQRDRLDSLENSRRNSRGFELDEMNRD